MLLPLIGVGAAAIRDVCGQGGISSYADTRDVEYLLDGQSTVYSYGVSGRVGGCAFSDGGRGGHGVGRGLGRRNGLGTSVAEFMAPGVGHLAAVVGGGGSESGVAASTDGVDAADGGRSCNGFVDGEMQGDHAVATRRISEAVRQVFARFGDILVFVPVEAVASDDGGVARIAVVDDEVECDDGVAALGVATHDGVGGGAVALGVSVVVDPRVAVAGRLSVGAVGLVVDGQVERDHGVAALSVAAGDGVRGGAVALGVGDAVNPGVAVASFLNIGAVSLVLDGQVECDDGVAALRVSFHDGVGSGVVALGVGDAVNPGVAFARHLLVNSIGFGIHADGCHHGRVAAAAVVDNHRVGAVAHGGGARRVRGTGADVLHCVGAADAHPAVGRC